MLLPGRDVHEFAGLHLQRLVLDPLAGSDSIVVAAQRLGHARIGGERNPEYRELALKGLEIYGRNEPAREWDNGPVAQPPIRGECVRGGWTSPAAGHRSPATGTRTDLREPLSCFRGERAIYILTPATSAGETTGPKGATSFLFRSLPR